MRKFTLHFRHNFNPPTGIMSTKEVLVPDEIVISKIYLIRNQKVMLDSNLAELYGVETKRLNEQVTRNIDRFPEDFMFRLDENEYQILKSQLNCCRWQRQN